MSSDPCSTPGTLLDAARSPVDECTSCGCYVASDVAYPLEHGYCCHYSCHCGRRWVANWIRSR